MSNRRRTFINMMSGGAGFLLPMAVNFFATPFLLEKLGAEAFGLQTFVNVILGYLLVADMGLDVPVIKYLSEYTAKNNIGDRNKLLNNTLQIYIILGLFGLLVIFFAEPFMYGLFNIPDQLKPEAKIVFWLAGIGFFWNIICVWGKAVFIGIQRFDISNGIFIGFSLISTFSGLIMVYNGMGVVSFVFSKVIGFFLSAITYLIVGKLTLSDYKFSFGFNKAMLNVIKPLIGYGLIMRISGMIFGRLDQSFIGAWVGIAAVGIYSIPLMICTAVTGLISGVMSYTFPRASELFSLKKTEDLRLLYISSSKYVTLAAVLAFSLLIGFGRQFVGLWINEDVAASIYPPLVVLSIASIIQIAVNSITNNYLVALDGMKLFAINSFIRGLITMTGFFFLIKPFGILGASLGVLITSFYDVIFLLFVLNRFINIRFVMLVKESYLKSLLVGLLCSVVIFGLKDYVNSWITLFLSGLIYIGIFSIVVFILKVFDSRETSIIRNVFTKRNHF